MTRRGSVSLLKLNSWLEEDQGPVMGLNPHSHHSLSYPEQHGQMSLERFHDIKMNPSTDPQKH